MTAVLTIGAVAALVLAWLLVTPWLRQRRRGTRLAAPLEVASRSVIERNVPAARALPAPLRARLEGLVNAFVAEKSFVGCNGLQITEEIRTTIAALACLLVLERRSHYDELRSILVYPGAFWVEDEVEDEDGVVTQRRRELAGEAWDSSRIILSWEDVLESADYPGEGYNVVLHEFAHYLDAEGFGPAAAAVGDKGPRPAERWAQDLAREFETLVELLERGDDALLDTYAAEDEFEFFAVATEEFFDRPLGMRADNARLYELMQEYYALDPASWSRTDAAAVA